MAGMELVRSGSLFLVIAVASIMVTEPSLSFSTQFTFVFLQAQVHDVSPEVRQAVLLKNAVRHVPTWAHRLGLCVILSTSN